MAPRTFRPETNRKDMQLSMLLGVLFALTLFFAMALSQLIGDVDPPKSGLVEEVVAYVPPEIEQIEEEEPPPPEKEEPPPELERETPQLSLDQLDIALNPGTGGSLAGDFAMPTINTSAKSLGTEDFVDFSDLDQIPRPIGVSGFNFPRRLLRKKVSGRIVLLIKLDADGSVMDVAVDSSDLPKFDDFVVGEVGRWRFSPPTQQGQPVRAKARLPIPINIQ